MFREDILEQAAEELILVKMTDPGYELKLRQIAGKLLDYRQEIIVADDMLFWDDDISIEVRDKIAEKLAIPEAI